MNKLTLGGLIALTIATVAVGVTIKSSTASPNFTVTQARYNGHTHQLHLKVKSARAQTLKVTYKGRELAKSTTATKHHQFDVKFRGYGTFKVTNGHLTRKVAAKRYATKKPALHAAKTPAQQKIWQPTVTVPKHSRVTLKFRGKTYHVASKNHTQVTFKIPVRSLPTDQAFRQEIVTLTAKQPHKKTSKPLHRKIGLDFPA